MRKIRDVLRLSAGGMSKRKIAISLGIGATAAGDCIRRARRAGLAWPLPDAISDEALIARLFPASAALAAIKARRPRPDWPAIHRELRRKGVTLPLPDLHREAVHAAAHVRPADRQPDPHPARTRDHRRRSAAITAAARSGTTITSANPSDPTSSCRRHR
jgi:hypothetical protein